MNGPLRERNRSPGRDAPSCLFLVADKGKLTDVTTMTSAAALGGLNSILRCELPIGLAQGPLDAKCDGPGRRLFRLRQASERKRQPVPAGDALGVKFHGRSCSRRSMVWPRARRSSTAAM